ncbi:MAG: hypothetical protein M3P33_04375 [bacterium]|nr:hypothetical protein [bacterium]
MQISTRIGNIENHRTYTHILHLIEEYLSDMGYLHIKAPLLSPVLIPESYLEIFKTEFVYPRQKTELYLIPSSELFLKRLISQDIGSCFSLDKSFRNSEPSTAKHSHEFMMLEFYKVGGDYFDVAKDTLSLMRFISNKLYNKNTIKYKDHEIDLSEWEKITVAGAFKKYAQVKDIFNEEAFIAEAKKKGYATVGMSYVDLWSQIYSYEVEPHLGTNGKPTIIYEYPRALSATAKYDPIMNVCERLEIYICGIELGNCGNAGSPDMNMDELKNTFENDIVQRNKNGMIEHKADYSFLDVVKALPQCAGIAIGVERLAMVMANLSSISQLQLIEVEK